MTTSSARLRRSPADPRETWSLRLPPTADGEQIGGKQGADDTLHVLANVESWARLAAVFDEARVPMEVGDVDVMRQAAKLDQELLNVLIRWIRTANPPA
ncbi:hypothetical protein ASE03_30825 [Kitasatospora sp. Root187]|uniref:hypothetical protein n=1 Tax=Kitasatospora sp. Root187 TaxID=1736486 RepID=UPI0007133E61|nr:hypothetical protein [Kitasatospora sp. Root187]KRB66418.1 hypothetical protein ASE03_30825 [Kitasatospora sp. Root187]